MIFFPVLISVLTRWRLEKIEKEKFMNEVKEAMEKSEMDAIRSRLSF